MTSGRPRHPGGSRREEEEGALGVGQQYLTAIRIAGGAGFAVNGEYAERVVVGALGNQNLGSLCGIGRVEEQGTADLLLAGEVRVEGHAVVTPGDVA